MDIKELIKNVDHAITNANTRIKNIIVDGETGHLEEQLDTPVELVYQKGGTEGGGDYVCGVIRFIEYNIYLKIEGYYASYEGCTFEDEWFQVFPREITTIVYEKADKDLNEESNDEYESYGDSYSD